MIWVVSTPHAAIDVAAHLGGLDAELASYNLAGYVLERDVLLTAEINWKFVLDGFLEVYHIPKLHSDSIAPWIYGKYSPFDRFDRNSRLVGVRKSFSEARGDGFESMKFLKHVAVNYQIFPNSIAVWQGDHFEVWTSYPGQKPDECKVRVQSLVTKDMNDERYKSRWDRNWKVLIDTVVSEDWAMSREVQSTLPFVSDKRIMFGRNEPGLQHFHSVLDQAIQQTG